MPTTKPATNRNLPLLLLDEVGDRVQVRMENSRYMLLPWRMILLFTSDVSR